MEKKEKSLIYTLLVLIIAFAGILVFLLLPLLETVREVPSKLEKTKVVQMQKEVQNEEKGISIAVSDITVKVGSNDAVTAAVSGEKVLSNSDYVIPESNTRRLSAADISGLTKEQLALARNEILARHGRIFRDAPFPDYFNSKSWYHGTVSPDEFDANMDDRISEIEKANIELIKSYE